MASYGEVSAMPSRAVDDDDDDLEEESMNSQTLSSCVLRWSPSAREEMESSETHRLHCTVLVVAVGHAATGFTQSHIMFKQKTEVLGVVCSGLDGRDRCSLSQHAITDKTCYIYRLTNSPGVLVCLSNTHVTAEQSFSWTKQLFQCINTSNCYTAVLGTSPIAEYISEKCTSDLIVPFLRSLKTSTFHGQPHTKYLEQPNTLKGLPAQILTYCQISRIPAVLFMCYTDTQRLDIATMMSFQAILQSTPIKDIVQDVDLAEAGKMMLTLVEQQSVPHSLYI